MDIEELNKLIVNLQIKIDLLKSQRDTVNMTSLQFDCLISNLLNMKVNLEQAKSCYTQYENVEKWIQSTH